MKTEKRADVAVENIKKHETSKKYRDFEPGRYERMEEYRATVIDTNVSIRRNIERNYGNYMYY